MAFIHNIQDTFWRLVGVPKVETRTDDEFGLIAVVKDLWSATVDHQEFGSVSVGFDCPRSEIPDDQRRLAHEALERLPDLVDAAIECAAREADLPPVTRSLFTGFQTTDDPDGPLELSFEFDDGSDMFVAVVFRAFEPIDAYAGD